MDYNLDQGRAPVGDGDGRDARSGGYETAPQAYSTPNRTYREPDIAVPYQPPTDSWAIPTAPAPQEYSAPNPPHPRTEAPRVYPPPVEAQAPPVVPAPPVEEKKQGALQKIAALVAVAILSGAAGGGATYALMARGDAAAERPAETPGEAVLQSDAPSVSPSLAAPASSVIDVARKASDSVVEIAVEMVGGNSFFGRYVTEGGGSGVILTEDGYIVTNDHVIEFAQAITVRTKDGSEYSATLVGTDSKTDLAVIKVDAAGLRAVSYADSDQIQVGEVAVAIGNPLGTLGGTVTDGIISARDREISIGGETMTLLQTSAAVNPGNSGGGLFNQDGDLVGIINAKSAGLNVEGLGFAIPSNLVRQVSEELMRNGYVSGRPQLGITVREIADVRTAWMYGVEEPGIYIVTAGEGSPLEVNDRIVRVGGVEVLSTGDIKKAIEGLRVGDSVEVTVMRSGRETTVQVTLQEQTPISAEAPPVQEDDM